MNILFTTTNEHKIKEIEFILNNHLKFFKSGVNIEFLNILEENKSFKKIAKKISVPNELGDSYEENSRIKAHYYGEILQMPVITEDSGIEIESLDNKPGIHSATWLEKLGNNKRNLEAINLVNQKNIANRQAKYICVLTFYNPVDGKTKQFRGEAIGSITMKPSTGKYGFGYDPIFSIAVENNLTFADMPLDMKSKYSHRSKAFKLFVDWMSKAYLTKILDQTNNSKKNKHNKLETK